MKTATITLQLEFPEGQGVLKTMALAQFAKRCGWKEYSENACADHTAGQIRDAVSELQNALARAGYNPR